MEARSTQSVVLVLGEGGHAARATQSTTLAVSGTATPPRVTQSNALAVSGTPAPARVTNSLALVLAPPPSPSRATHSLALLTTATSPQARSTQSLALIVSSLATENQTRVTQSLALIVAGAAASASLSVRTTQALALLLADASCAADLDGCGRYTLAKLRERVLRVLGDDPTDPVYWDEDEIENYVNEAYTAMARDSKAYQFSESIAVVQGTASYTLDAMTMKVKRVFLDQTPLRPATPYEMDRLRAGWGFEAKTWGYISTQQVPQTIRLVDTPDAAGTLTVYSVGIPAALDGNCDTPELPSWCHQGIVFGAAARALNRFGEQRNPELAAVCNAAYGEYLTVLKAYAETL